MGDYSAWFESMIKDEELKRQAAKVEQDPNLSPQESRVRIKQAVESRFHGARLSQGRPWAMMPR